jgi:TolB-like protein/DNA-binding winged helix-turn-helix (wHTH) protein/Flp pilus assembly protein TadD
MASPLYFGHAEVRLSERQILVDGRPVFVGARAFEVLSLLITHRERVVGKNELLEAVWPGVVVEENNLQVQISTLRKVLGPGAISTISGQGYQFTATLDSERGTLPDAGSAHATPETALPARQRSSAPGTPLDAGAPRPGAGIVRHAAWLAAGLALLLAIGIGAWPLLRPKPQAAAVAPVGTNTQRPPAHSVAVLPFVNNTGDPTQDYFSDGLSEELLNSLSKIRDLQVAAGTSSLAFKGKDTKVAEIGHELNVASVLEGSVRKDGSHVRITALLIDTATGFLVWSQSYDRDLKDVLKLQTEIATAVTKTLQATLLADAGAIIELGGTQNPQALDAYLRGMRWRGNMHTQADYSAAIGEFSEAIRLDPRFAKAYALKSIFLTTSADYVPDSGVRRIFERARATAEQAVTLAPGLGEAHTALALVLQRGFLDFSRAAVEYDRALALSPGDARVMAFTARFFAEVGRADEAVAIVHRAVALDPLSASTHATAGEALGAAHRYGEAIREFDRALSLNPQHQYAAASRGLTYLALGAIEPARQSCATPPIDWETHLCLAIIYDKLHQRADAQKELAALEAEQSAAAAFQYAEIYAQWGDVPKALDSIEKAYQRKDSGLVTLKVDYLLDPLRREPRFQKIERELAFPG